MRRGQIEAKIQTSTRSRFVDSTLLPVAATAPPGIETRPLCSPITPPPTTVRTGDKALRAHLIAVAAVLCGRALAAHVVQKHGIPVDNLFTFIMQRRSTLIAAPRTLQSRRVVEPHFNA